MISDLRHGLRMVMKNPGFAFIAIISIAIGVGANAAMFSLADGLVLRPLNVPRSNEIVAVSAMAPRVGANFVASGAMSRPDYLDLRDRAQSFNGLLAYRTIVTGFSGRQNEPPQSVFGLAVSGNFFDVLGLQPALGRFFLPDEDRVAGRDAVMVIAHDVWSDRFGGDPMILSRRVRLGGMDFEIIGVAPAGFEGMHLAVHPVYYVPNAMTTALFGAPPSALERRDSRGLAVKGRLKPGVSLAQARDEARLIAASLEKTYPDTNRGYGLLVKSDFEARLEERGPSAPAAFMLLTLAFVVLLVACANVAALLMSRGPAREREIALRLAIGGGRFRVIRQLITESVLLAAAGGVLGLLMGYVAVQFFTQLPLVSDIGVRLIFELDGRAIAVGLTLAAASAILSSLVPAWRATRKPDLVNALKTGTAGAGRASRLWGQNGLVAGQVALSVILLTVTVFLARGFEQELREPGFRTARLLLSNYEPRLARYDDSQTKSFYQQLKERALALPGVTSVGMTSVMPLNQDNRETTAIVPEGYQLPQGTESVSVLSSRIDEGFLGTMSIPVVRGRGIESIDTGDAPRVALINRAMAARYWPGQDPVGKRVRLASRDGQPWAEVVGVTADSKYNFIGEAPTPWMYVAQRQDPGFRTTFIVASQGDSAALAAPLRDVVRNLDPGMPVSGVRTIEEFYRGNAIGIVTALIAITASMGLLGLTLAMVGLYGLVAYVVARQTREIGIRMAVGAQSGSVLRMVLRRGFWRAAWGAVIGIAGCLGGGPLLRAVFPTVGSIDLRTYVTVISILAAVTLLASYIPARRAAHIDPLRALRQD
jgi:macrolide transport system ATP-binding/permease protein